MKVVNNINQLDSKSVLQIGRILVMGNSVHTNYIALFFKQIEGLNTF